MRSSFSSCPQHETFEELAALAAVGELSALEQERLRHHLEECPNCTEAYEAFADMVANDLGVAAAVRESSCVGVEGAEDTEAGEHLKRLRNRLKLSRAQVSAGTEAPQLRAASSQQKPSSIPGAYRRAAYGIAATLLLSLALTGGIALWRAERAASTARARARELQLAVDSLKQDKRVEWATSDNPIVKSLQESQRSRGSLQKSIAMLETKNGELLAREEAAQEKLAGAIATVEQLRVELEAKDADRERLAKLQQESDAKLHEALVELYQARQVVQTAAKDQSHQDTSLEAFEQPPSGTGTGPFSPSEVEARNLFGARDLHIVDVYDVTGDGRTKRTFGRVYYVEKKLLVFYAFDLENRGNHKRGTFQAWGYREANVGKALNLGLFTIDDSPTSRWVLTVNRPDVLAHIDAVFVTVEPPGGSKDPRGKKVLYANLVGPPNHP